jgi:arylsulfatase A-like enzyme
MIISYPGNKMQHGKQCALITELIDLYPTLAELCGLSDKQPKILQGESLAGIIKGEQQKRKKNVAYTLTNKNAASIRTERWRYNRWGENAEGTNEELYSHECDPEEFVNLVGDKNYEKVLKEMRTEFEKTREKTRNGLVTD